MKPSETTPLTSGVTYAFIQGRKQRLRQYQCCLGAILVGLIVTFAVVIVSFAVNDDLQNAVAAGTEGLDDRDDLERNATTLLLFSPSFKHQKSVATSARAGSLSRAGYARHLASEHYSRARGRKYDGTNPMELTCSEELRRLIDSARWSADLNCSRRYDCDASDRYRSYDGSCNNLNHTAWGAALTSFRRSLPAWYSDGIGRPRTTNKYKPLPEATKISNFIHRPLYRNDPKFTVMLAVWGQFFDHDITATAASRGRNGSLISCCSERGPDHPECFPVVENDRCMEFVRSAPAAECCLGPRNQMNQATAYIDGSMIYGSGKDVVDKLRTFRGGRMEMMRTEDGRDLLPASMDLDDGCNREQMNQEGESFVICFMKIGVEGLIFRGCHI